MRIKAQRPFFDPGIVRAFPEPADVQPQGWKDEQERLIWLALPGDDDDDGGGSGTQGEAPVEVYCAAIPVNERRAIVAHVAVFEAFRDAMIVRRRKHVCQQARHNIAETVHALHVMQAGRSSKLMVSEERWERATQTLQIWEPIAEKEAQTRSPLS